MSQLNAPVVRARADYDHWVELLKRGILFAVMTIDRAWTGAGITAPQMIARAWVMMARA